MKYDRTEIMKRAWVIKKKNNENVFGVCLKMAWAEAKAPKEEDKKEVFIDELITAGANRWQKYGKDRIYLDSRDVANLFGFYVEYYKTGNIAYAELDGEKISNSKASQYIRVLLTGYIDVKKMAFIPQCNTSCDKIFNQKIQEKIA